MNMKYLKRITAATNLDALRDVLNTIEAELTGDGAPKLTDVIDTTSLPVFGGTEPADTRGIYSWDESRILTPGNANNWIIRPRAA